MKALTSKFSKRSYNRSIKFAADTLLKKGTTMESVTRIIGEVYGAQWGKSAVKDIKRELKRTKKHALNGRQL